MKKFVSVLLSLILVLGVAPLSGLADLDLGGLFALKAEALDETGQCGDNVFWTYDSSTETLTISGTGDMLPYYYMYNSPFRNSTVRTITIKEGVTRIGDWAFSGCRSLTSVNIPNSVTSIGSGAFYECSSLTNITIPDSVTIIEDEVFSDCSSLESVDFGNGVTTIGTYAFMYCPSLTSVTIPDSVTFIGALAFGSVTKVNIDSIAAWCNICFGAEDEEPYYTPPFYSAIDLYLNNELITDLVIPEGVTSIKNCVFCGCKSLTSVTIPNSVTSIGIYAFRECSALTSITIPDSVTSIEDSAFSGCSSLESVDFGNGVTSIGSYAFSGCSLLESVTIPDSVTSIEDDVFSECSSLESVDFGNGVTSIGLQAFFGCTSLTSLTIPDSVTNIGSNAFMFCSTLESVIIGNGVTSVGNHAFYRGDSCPPCSVTIGNSTCVIPLNNDTFDSNITLRGSHGSTTIEYAKLFNKSYEFSDEHSFVQQFEMPATCGSYGYRFSKCSCGAEQNEAIDPLGHKDENGDGLCDSCGVSLGGAAAHEHTASEWIVKSEATCAESGIRIKKCTECDAILEVESIDKLPHTVSDWIVQSEATCADNGLKYKECTECGAIVEVGLIERLPHTVSDWVVDADPTCIVCGSRHTKCTICGVYVDVEEIPAPGHAPALVGAVAATADSDGYTGDTVCLVCGDLLEEGSVIPAEGNEDPGTGGEEQGKLSIWERIVQWFRSLLEKIKALFGAG